MSLGITSLSGGMAAATRAVDVVAAQLEDSIRAIAGNTIDSSGSQGDSVAISEPAMAMYKASMESQQMVGDFVQQSLESIQK